jgi:eukaryotic-like serine/threonine-protein kinase
LSDSDDGHLTSERYERQGIIGRGAQGVVYRAFDRWMKRPVAIKVLGSRLARQPQMAERFLRELRALSALSGTAAVEVFDIFRGEQGELNLVMELLVGSDLDDTLARLEEANERMDLVRLARIFDPIVDTLEVAHGAGILHRDLKPANVFLLEAGGVRLLDFGMARLRTAAPLTAVGTVMGSPSFMAPEIWSGQTERVDQRADVYSLAVILFRILSGSLPFAGQTLREKFLGTTSEERPSLFAKRPDLTPDADAWVAQALAVEPAERFRNVRALWNAFLTTFDIPDPKGRRSLWAAAKGMVLRIAGAQEETPLDMSAFSPMEAAAPSFTSEALARSVMIVDDGAQSLDLFGTHKEPPSAAPEPETAPESVEAAREQMPDDPEPFANRPARDSKPQIP